MALTTSSPELATMIATIHKNHGHGIPVAVRDLGNTHRIEAGTLGAPAAFANFAASLAKNGGVPTPIRDAANAYANGGGTLTTFIKTLANNGGISYLIRDAAQACLTATGTAN